ncbi:hypothetical protein NLJ89_g11011 [Agrocybe chaxingu]|uniref:NAD(P)-binding protein n=1 Tax=Agrocybe chaxingu TaxID=84603 RepID=A0A9W8JX34_9AGAR|nr:hypothetical protein NLJ89_g11011 [Agrocybe chaxingu]
MAVTLPTIVRDILTHPRGAATVAILPLLLALYRVLKKPRRPFKVPKSGERVLIIGASSGIGRTVARQYAERGAKVCVTGRREALLQEVETECRSAGESLSTQKSDVLAVVGDFSDVEDMVRLRSVIEAEWNGLDTLVVAAGVSALQPLMAVAGVEPHPRSPNLPQATKEDIQRTVDVAAAATRGNFVGPLVAAVTFVPLLTNTSKSPSILLVNSLASLIPPPTRTLYGSTKASSLVLYQALSVEHPRIAFSFFVPSTVEGDFRASAVDSGPVRELDPNKYGLKREDVARRCITAVDNQEKTVFMPGLMRYAHLLYWLWPSFIEGKASKKYNFTPS